MAIEKVIKVKVNAGDADDKLDKIVKELEEIKSGLNDVGSSSKKNLGDVEDKADKAAKSVGNIEKEAKKGKKGLGLLGKGAKLASSGIRMIGVALKATGIGLIVGAFLLFFETLKKNQKVVDVFDTAMNAIGMVVGDFINLITGDGGFSKVIDFFKKVFNNPLDSIKKFGDAVKQNLINRFNSYLDTLGFVASAIKKVFSGDFSGAMEDAKSAGSSLVDTMTGVPDTINKVGTAVKKAGNAITTYSTNIVNTASNLKKLEKAAEKAAQKQAELNAKFKKQAEDERQIRDDNSRSIEDRIAANDRLGKILDEQGKSQLKEANTQLQFAQAKLRIDKNNVEAQKLVADAKQNILDIEEEINGQQSEQLVNSTALKKESQDLADSRIKNANDVKLANDLANAPDLDAEQEAYNAFFEKERQRLKDKIALHEEGTQAYEDALKAQRDLDTQQYEYNKTTDEEREAIKREKELKIAEEEERLRLEKVARQQKMYDDIATLAGKETALGKAALIAKQLINAKEMILDIKRTLFKQKESIKNMGITATETMVNATSATAEGAAKTSKVGFPQNIPLIIGYAVQAAGIMSAVKSAMKGAKSAGASVRGGGSPPPRIASPQFNIAGATGNTQIANALNQQTNDLNNEPIRAYVVSSEISSAQALDRQTESNATFGG